MTEELTVSTKAEVPIAGGVKSDDGSFSPSK